MWSEKCADCRPGRLSMQSATFSVGFGTAAAANPQNWWRSPFDFPILGNALDCASTPAKAAAGSPTLTTLLEDTPHGILL
jgi:hypothetical protein